MDAPVEPTVASEREIVITRVFDAPRELVWNAWTDPDHLARWWGPRGFTTSTQRMEVKPGGVWRFVMHGPDGRDYQNMITYQEVSKPDRLVYKHGGDRDCEPVNFQVVVTFEKDGPAGNRTRVTMRSLFPSRNAREFVVRQYNAIEGGKQTLERLAEHLHHGMTSAASASGQPARPFVITRVFDAPLDAVWQAWTVREHLERWFGPRGVNIPTCTLDLRPGGTFHYCMRRPDGGTMWGKWVFREIVPGKRLVFVTSFSDPEGGITRSPFGGDWPLETLSTITFAEHAGIGGGTTVVVEWAPINATEAEARAFEDGHASMREGWGGTLDRLAGHLAGTPG